MPSYYCPDLDGQAQTLMLSKEESHHLLHVLRGKQGDIIHLNNGQGWRSEGRILAVEKNQVVVETLNAEYTHPPQPAFAIAFSLLRNKNDAWLVEKTTELGVAELYPIVTRNSVRTPTANTVDKFKTDALSAIKQCENPWLPVIHPVLSLQQALDEVIYEGYRPVVASERRPDVWLDSFDRKAKYCFMIGPEGGFNQEEFDLMERMNVQSIALSSNILRAETAAVTIAAQFNLLRRS